MGDHALERGHRQRIENDSGLFVSACARERMSLRGTEAERDRGIGLAEQRKSNARLRGRGALDRIEQQDRGEVRPLERRVINPKAHLAEQPTGPGVIALGEREHGLEEGSRSAMGRRKGLGLHLAEPANSKRGVAGAPRRQSSVQPDRSAGRRTPAEARDRDLHGLRVHGRSFEGFDCRVYRLSSLRGAGLNDSQIQRARAEEPDDPPRGTELS